jgi:hypothetical protein
MSYVYAVTITKQIDRDYEETEVVRVFTKRPDAETFIATCEEVDDREWWDYGIHKIELDGDPRGTI